MLFQIKSLSVHYNKVRALRAVSMEVDEGDIVTLIGANGAGKSTTLRTVSGLVRASAGEIWFDGARIDTLPADEVVRRGIAHVPEGRHVFPELTVFENLNTGAFLRRDKDGIKQDLEAVYERFPPAQGAAHPVRQDPLGRRAADAGDRPGAHGAAQAAAAR